jgi:hypothetical protein
MTTRKASKSATATTPARITTTTPARTTATAIVGTTADSPFDFAQGRLFGNDNKKSKNNSNSKA